MVHTTYCNAFICVQQDAVGAGAIDKHDVALIKNINNAARQHRESQQHGKLSAI